MNLGQLIDPAWIQELMSARAKPATPARPPEMDTRARQGMTIATLRILADASEDLGAGDIRRALGAGCTGIESLYVTLGYVFVRGYVTRHGEPFKYRITALGRARLR